MYKKILLPTDGSTLATQAALEGVAFAEKVGAELVSVYVMPERPVLQFDTLCPSKEEYDGIVRKAAEKAAAPIRDAASAAGLKLTERSCSAVSVAKSIVAVAADSGCDLIYMASRGHSGWDKFFLGSTASAVIAESPIPVLIYKVNEKQLPTNYWEYATPVG